MIHLLQSQTPELLDSPRSDFFAADLSANEAPKKLLKISQSAFLLSPGESQGIGSADDSPFFSLGIFSILDSEMLLDTPLKSPKAVSKAASTSNPRMTSIDAPHRNDVLMGRGGKNNQHTGNETLREFARQRSEEYRIATKKGKSDISRELVRLMRELKPMSRFLRKDSESCKWEDVGDDIAREKTSQVLRDAVSEKNGPMARSKTKSPAPTEEILSIASQGPSTPLSTSFDTKKMAISARHPRQQREFRADRGSAPVHYHHPYLAHASSFDHMRSMPATPQNPSVTPAATTLARKRPRASESPMAPPYKYFSPYSQPYISNTSPSVVFSPPAPRQQLSRPSPGYFSITSSQRSISRQRSPASAMIPIHYMSQGSGERNEPWLADINSQYSTPRPTAPPSNDFDLYHEELLSDHSDHRDGSVSPFSYPKRDSL